MENNETNEQEDLQRGHSFLESAFATTIGVAAGGMTTIATIHHPYFAGGAGATAICLGWGILSGGLNQPVYSGSIAGLSGAAVGSIPGVLMDDPFVTLMGMAAGTIANPLYLSKRPVEIQKPLLRRIMAAGLATSIGVLAGNTYSNKQNAINEIRPFETPEYRGVVVETNRDISPYAEIDDRFVPLSDIREQEIERLQKGLETKFDKVYEHAVKKQTTQPTTLPAETSD